MDVIRRKALGVDVPAGLAMISGEMPAVSGVAGMPNGAVTSNQLAKLGTRFAVRATAAGNLAKTVAEASHGDAAAILETMEANLVPNSVMVPAGIIAVNRTQERGYTFSFCG